METKETLSRRELLWLAGGAGATGAFAGAADPAAAQAGQTHTVDMTDQLVFDPDSLTVAPGDTVRWENVGTVGHSVTAYEEEIPDGAEYWAAGGFDGESAARSGYPSQGDVPGGESFEHTFETTGTHSYFCIPHESVGMVGEIVVQEGGATEAPGVSLPSVPDSAKALAVSASAILAAVLGLAYFFIKYGGDYPND